MTNLDTLERLTDWLGGTLTMVFSHGATVTRHVPLSTAIDVRQIAAGAREPDGLRWCDTGWLQVKAKEVVFLDFTLDEDGGWTLSADDRRTLDRTPYNRGVLVALRDYWQTQTSPEVAYSARALVTLHHQALTNPSPESWARVVRAFEGETGALRARALHDLVEEEEAAATTDREDDPAARAPAPSEPGHDDSNAPHSRDVDIAQTLTSTAAERPEDDEPSGSPEADGGAPGSPAEDDRGPSGPSSAPPTDE